MFQRVRFVMHQVAHDLRVGLLLRPGLITGALATTAVALTLAERDSRAFAALMRTLPLFHGEPATAQLVLGTISASMMTVVSIVYSVLIMALTLTSIQFSPRVMSSFMRDSTSQTTLGVFIGTFTYCILVLPGVRVDPPFVPSLSVSLALVLALMSLAWLVYFIHHIGRSIQANHIVDLIAAETEIIIDEVFPAPLDPGERDPEEAPPPRPPADAARVDAPSSGYVQLIDLECLRGLAASLGVEIRAERGVGEYVPEGGALVTIWPGDLVTPDVREACAGAFDLGPVRTMQHDAEFGVRQIVDVALKAISPAVNDPSTAVTCIDHLSRLIARVARRRSPARIGGLHVRLATFQSMLDLAFNQIRQYGRADLAVSLRILRALAEIAQATTDPSRLTRIGHHARLVGSGCAAFDAPDRAKLQSRLQDLEALLVERGLEPGYPAP
jgi:uncharacterized membrane protein